METTLVTSPEGILSILIATCLFFFYLEKTGKMKSIFKIFPPLIFIYLIPVFYSNSGLIPQSAPVYDTLKTYLLPLFITLMLLDVDIRQCVKVMKRGTVVMLFGTLGVIVGAVGAYAIVKNFLEPEAWKAFGTLAGSWIGGTGNMAAVAGALNTPEHLFGIAVLADNLVYLVWLPIMLASKNWNRFFQRFTGVSDEYTEKMHELASNMVQKDKTVEMTHVLGLLFCGFAVTWAATTLSTLFPVLEPVFSPAVWRMLLITTFALLLSFSPAKKLQGSHAIAMALIYVFVSMMGARADLSGLTQAPWFIAGAFIWIFIHGLFCLLGAKIMKVDVHTAAIASAANIGGAASAPIVAAYHNESLVPVSILMSLIGYAVGNYGALLAAQICYWIGG
ncbi:MAG: hypothetical protein COX62_05970 [Deltaproteobacteria bacterium CG_4_10_14_0_2_um_filter_43_8]|nr:MAG: hypothetical protein COV43_01575 [Deltaproteobacteria bacterium CG11_big_fil_rev_8_21_14_0_20_42_23]PJA19779.1 MAG: hypothetical protein COX62_05970 [Deltaproteobacteria bacterium CG_4_10_14_0_2_um_filter_43_8]PJC64659.1 MAG: hypothetical protein CO021_03090 [Deltaproteobacteria bacterium CG_4_9_14_0_2_um_filter_42_21]